MTDPGLELYLLDDDTARWARGFVRRLHPEGARRHAEQVDAEEFAYLADRVRALAVEPTHAELQERRSA